MVFKARTFYGQIPEGEEPQAASAGLENRVADTLASVHGLDASDVQVTLEESTIVLTGYVSQPEEIDLAEDAARSVPGVNGVDNLLTLPPDA